MLWGAIGQFVAAFHSDRSKQWQPIPQADFPLTCFCPLFPTASSFLGGGNDGKGPRNPAVCCWDNSDNSGERMQATQGLLACCVAAAGVATVSWPHPATAANVNDTEGTTPSITASRPEAQQVASSGVCLTEEEKELLDPKQYRVREWVYVH